MNEDNAPIQHTSRIIGLDVARALAITGMAWIHFALVLSANHFGSTTSGYILENILDGRPAAMFMIIAGIGISLRLNDKREITQIRSIRKTLVRRGVFFLIVGFGVLIFWPGDILRVYGIAYLAAACHLTTSSVRIVALISLVVLSFLILIFVIPFETNWDFETMEYHHLWTISGGTLNLFYNGFRAVLPWVGLLFLGMLIGRLNLRSPRIRFWLILICSLLCLVVETISFVALKSIVPLAPPADQEDLIAILGTTSLPPLPLFIIASSCFAIAVIVSLISLCELWKSAACVRWFAFAGQMAFTWYIAHLVIVLLAGAATGFSGDVPIVLSIGATFGFIAVMLIISAIIKQRFKHGPLEYILRKVS